jgi:hypothetical protein
MQYMFSLNIRGKLLSGRLLRPKRERLSKHSISFKSAYLSPPLAKQELAPYTNYKSRTGC